MAGISRAGRRAAAAAAVTCGGVAMVAVVAACGSVTGASGTSPSVNPGGPASSVSPSTPPSSPPASPTSAPAPAKTQCATPDLVAKVATVRGGAAAGSSYVPVNFTNISSHRCVMFGYPGVSWVTGMRGSQIGDAAARTTGYPPVPVTLPPGGAAHAWLQIADAGNFPASSCKPVTAHWLRIYPPDQYRSRYAKFTAQVCSGKITGGSKPLLVLPVRAGKGASGQVP